MTDLVDLFREWSELAPLECQRASSIHKYRFLVCILPEVEDRGGAWRSVDAELPTQSHLNFLLLSLIFLAMKRGYFLRFKRANCGYFADIFDSEYAPSYTCCEHPAIAALYAYVGVLKSKMTL